MVIHLTFEHLSYKYFVRRSVRASLLIGVVILVCKSIERTYDILYNFQKDITRLDYF